MAHITKLRLYRAITYVKDENLKPFEKDIRAIKESEMLFCFKIPPPSRAVSAEEYFSGLLEAGYELFDGEIHEEMELPSGEYFFAQERSPLSREAVFTLAEEMREVPGAAAGEKLYLRYIFEDGRAVTQLFLPEDVEG